MPRLLTAEEVRSESLPPQNGGVSNDSLNIFVVESEGTVERALGELPEDDMVIRGIVRDYAAARALFKLAETDEDYTEAQKLETRTDNALARYIKFGGPEPPGEGTLGEGVNENAVANVDDSPLWTADEFAIGRSRQHITGGDPEETWPW